MFIFILYFVDLNNQKFFSIYFLFLVDIYVSILTYIKYIFLISKVLFSFFFKHSKKLFISHIISDYQINCPHLANIPLAPYRVPCSKRN